MGLARRPLQPPRGVGRKKNGPPDWEDRLEKSLERAYGVVVGRFLRCRRRSRRIAASFFRFR